MLKTLYILIRRNRTLFDRNDNMVMTRKVPNCFHPVKIYINMTQIYIYTDWREYIKTWKTVTCAYKHSSSGDISLHYLPGKMRSFLSLEYLLWLAHCRPAGFLDQHCASSGLPLSPLDEWLHWAFPAPPPAITSEHQKW